MRVPQHLDLEDVLVFGLGAVDLLCLAAGGFVAWWLYLAVPGATELRVALATPFLLAGTVFGLGRLGGETAREFAVALARYLRRPRLRVYEVEP
ncbi:MAG: PrgI family mobile element protein [Candidatus Dormibacteria bacterium]